MWKLFVVLIKAGQQCYFGIIDLAWFYVGSHSPVQAEHESGQDVVGWNLEGWVRDTMQAMRAPAATKNGQHVQALKYLENDGGNGSHQFIPEFHLFGNLTWRHLFYKSWPNDCQCSWYLRWHIHTRADKVLLQAFEIGLSRLIRESALEGKGKVMEETEVDEGSCQSWDEGNEWMLAFRNVLMRICYPPHSQCTFPTTSSILSLASS